MSHFSTLFAPFPLFLHSKILDNYQLMDKLIYVIPAMGIVGLFYTFIKYAWVSKQDAGNERMKEISTYIAEGAMAFLKAEYKILAYFVIIGALLLGLMGYTNANSHWSILLCKIWKCFRK